MSVTININDLDIQVTADRLTREAFAPFGDVVTNPRPDLHPTAYASQGGKLPYEGVSANQGTAIKYSHVSKPRNLYAQAPSGNGELIMSQFVCEARQLKETGDSSQREFTVSVLERHPFTSQTFSPLMSTSSMYLVIVAPSLPPSPQDEGLPVPTGDGLPGRGLPDLRGLRAFVATNRQAVTYGAGTWHAPMVAMGKEATTLDFLVVQFASGVAEEDCQLSVFEPDEPKAEIQTLYSVHRTKRNAQQAEKFLDSNFKELIIDQYLLRLEDQTVEPGFRDPRNCLVFWARPPDHVIRLAGKLQELLKQAAPNVWLMPTHRMHLTVLEIAFSKTPDEIASLVSTLRPSIPSIVNYPYSHRSRLVKPMISYDLSAFAVSFLPAAGEASLSPPPTEPIVMDGITQGDDYTYHHLRRDVFDQVQAGGVEVGSRYQVPSAHITLGRYLNHSDHDTPEKRASWVKAINEINQWLEKEVWDNPDSEFVGEWIVGQEKGLDARNGTLWYGGGRTIVLGEGF
ncbi:hypothetical protein NCS52_00091000 [Fusarium sp. LHS14.1]|nr:hypothetical protein NCS52_00091000 [Fusarium sp. LHS14.1]